MDVPGTRTERIATNGITLETAVAAPARAPDGRARLALLLHGFPELNYSWRFQIPVFTQAGYTVWAPNLRGYGGSDRPEGIDAYRLDTLVEDVAGLIDAARGRGVADEVCLVAHDWGGVIAWYFMLAAARPVDRFIVMNLPHPTRMAQELRHWRQFRRSWYGLFFQLPWLPEKLLGANGAKAIGDAFYNMAVDKSRFPPEVLDVYRAAALRPGALTAMVNYYRAVLRRRTPLHALTQDPPVIAAPTLMIWGEEDSALCVETTDNMDALMGDFTLRRLPGVSHWVQQEAPEAVNALLAAWLAGAPLPSAGEALALPRGTATAAAPATSVAAR